MNADVPFKDAELKYINVMGRQMSYMFTPSRTASFAKFMKT